MSLIQSETEEKLPGPTPDEPPERAPGWLSRWIESVRHVFRPRSGAPVSPFFLLRRRLVLSNVLVACIVLVVLSGAVYAYVAQTDLAQIDQILSDEANHEVQVDISSEGEQSQTSVRPTYTPTGPDVFSVELRAPQTIVQDNEQVASVGLPDWTAATAVLSGRASSVYSTVTLGAYTYRLYTVAVRDDGRVVAAVQTGTSLVRHQQILDDLVRALAILGASVLLLTGVSSVYLTQRALAPAFAAYLRERQFNAAASHELRTPLAVIRSQADLISGLLRDAFESMRAPNPDMHQLASQLVSAGTETEGITAEVDYMTRMVRDLLVLARDTSDTGGLLWESVDLRTLVQETADKVRPLAVAKQLTLEAPTAADERQPPAQVWGDADRLRQLVLIFLENAVKYTPAGGSIHVHVHADTRHHLISERSRHVELTISDTGEGIPVEHLPHIFEPFYRATMHHLSEDASGSTGLGLALAKWIANAHGGDIAVASTAGKGTTFTIVLPQASESD